MSSAAESLLAPSTSRPHAGPQARARHESPFSLAAARRGAAIPATAWSPTSAAPPPQTLSCCPSSCWASRCSSRSASSSSTASTTPPTRSPPSSTPTRSRRTWRWCTPGALNFLGVLVSSGAVAFGIITLLPVELILQVGSSAGFAMVFALLIAAIIWNLGTWWLGLPASSSHTLIGSIIGVGVANALMHGRDGTSGVDWGQATKVGYSLLFSPLVGFVCAGAAAAGAQGAGQEPRALPGAQGRRRPAVVDPRAADPHLRRGVLRARLERRPEGHGPHHADPDRHRAHGLCAQSRHAGRAR